MNKDNPYHNEGMWKGAPPQNFAKAKALREKMTAAETLLWKELQNAPFSQLKFRRQHPIQNYIADFYSHSLKLIIEVDGEYHESAEQIKKDEERAEVLRFNGLEIIRFTNEAVLNDTTRVLKEIEEKIDFKRKSI